MDLGTGLFTCQRRPDDDRSFEAIYDEMVELARTADAVGLASAWVSEHHFVDDGYLPGTMPSLGAIAAATDDIEIGTCIALAPLYDHVRLAEDAATVSLLSGGRCTVGLSIGYRDLEFEAFGAPREERTERTEEAVKLLRAAWSPGPLGFDPEFHPVSGELSVTPKPETTPPIVLGGGAKPAVRRAARMADGWVAPSSLSIEGLRKRVEDIERVREEEGIDGEFQVYLLQHGFVGDTEEEAWETMREGYLYMMGRYAEWFADEDEDAEIDAEREAELREQAICGPPSTVAERLDEYRDALGDDVHFIFRSYQPGVGREAMIECLQRLGDEVAPQV